MMKLRINGREYSNLIRKKSSLEEETGEKIPNDTYKKYSYEMVYT